MSLTLHNALLRGKKKKKQQNIAPFKMTKRTDRYSLPQKQHLITVALPMLAYSWPLQTSRLAHLALLVSPSLSWFCVTP